MRTAILTIPSQINRIYALFGHLQTIGFPVVDRPDIFRIYQGFNRHNYANRADAIEAMIDNGHLKYKRVLDREFRPDLEKIDPFTDICTWGMLNILRRVAESNKPMLVLENDAYFIGITYEEINTQWETLVDRVGYNNINVAMFTVLTPNLVKYRGKAPLEDVSDFWVKGATAIGQTANIYTPHGAQFVLDNLPCYPNIETWIYHGENTDDSYGNISGIYSSREGVINLYFFSNFDSPHTHARDPKVWHKFFEGESL